MENLIKALLSCAIHASIIKSFDIHNIRKYAFVICDNQLYKASSHAILADYFFKYKITTNNKTYGSLLSNYIAIIDYNTRRPDSINDVITLLQKHLYKIIFTCNPYETLDSVIKYKLTRIA